MLDLISSKFNSTRGINETKNDLLFDQKPLNVDNLISQEMSKKIIPKPRTDSLKLLQKKSSYENIISKTSPSNYFQQIRNKSKTKKQKYSILPKLIKDLELLKAFFVTCAL